MSTIELLRGVWQLAWRPLLQTILIIVTYGWLPNQNLATLILTILVYLYLFKLLFSEAPTLKQWLVVYPLLTTLIIGVFYLLYYWAGAFGLLGAAVLLVGIAGLRIWQSWALFDAVTTWGAERVRGKHDHAFDIQKVVKDADGSSNKEEVRCERAGEGEDAVLPNAVPQVPADSGYSDNGGQASAVGTTVRVLPAKVRKKAARKVKA